MIVATAGHIDHGKTSLVKALTGVDADRLPEEKARGITLDLGFAYRRRDGVSLGFVDVPGHEKLVRTMVAGSSGVDFALLVVAADDGVMPQTREHLAILDLLGLDRGLVAITKSDRVDDARLAAVTQDVRSLVDHTSLRNKAILVCSAQTGAGIPDLADALAREATAGGQRRAAGSGFRLAVDRAFTLQGVGLVVTGAVHAGRVRVGDRLLLSPGNRETRVRGIRAQNREAEEGGIGDRLALNLVGTRLSREDVHRGDWIITPELHAPATRLDATLRVLASEAKALRHRTPVQVHLGSAAVTGRVLLLDERALQPGESGIAQVTLNTPIGALGGDRFVLRDISAQRTLGGGRVVDPFGPRRVMRTPARRAMLEALAEQDDALALSRAIAASEGGIDLDHFRLVRNLDPETEAALLTKTDVLPVAGATARLGFPAARVETLQRELVATLEAAHRTEPDNPGLTVEELGNTLPRSLQPALRLALQRLLDAGEVHRRGSIHHRPSHVVRLSPVDAELWERIRALQVKAGLDQLRIVHLAERLKMEADEIRPLLDKLGRIGWLRRFSKSYYVLPQTAADLARIAATVASTHPDRLLTVGNFRDAAGIGRNMTMPVLEHFDAAGFTTRLHEGRRIRGDWRVIFAIEDDEASRRA